MQGEFVLKGRWRLYKKIGQGAFGETFLGEDIQTKQPVAVKLEGTVGSKQVLKLEVSILRKLQESPYVCRFYNCGRTQEHNFLVMELLGENLSELRRKQPSNRFSMATSVRLGLQMLHAIESMHFHGYLHRDIKPSNFAMGVGSNKHRCFVLDFGLSRRYLLQDGSMRPPRDQAGFRGTSRYASLNSHNSLELSRRDDLWSFFYMMIEFIMGGLPWRRLKDKIQIGEMKKQCNNPELVRGLPSEFLAFFNYLTTLKYEEVPDYRYIEQLLLDIYRREGYPPEIPYDWEQPNTLLPHNLTNDPRSLGQMSADPPSQRSENDQAAIDDMNEGAQDADFDVTRKTSIGSTQQSRLSPRLSPRSPVRSVDTTYFDQVSPSVSPPGSTNGTKSTTQKSKRSSKREGGHRLSDAASNTGSVQTTANDGYYIRPSVASVSLYGDQGLDSLPASPNLGRIGSRDGLHDHSRRESNRSGILPSFQQGNTYQHSQPNSSSQDPRLLGFVESGLRSPTHESRRDKDVNYDAYSPSRSAQQYTRIGSDSSLPSKAQSPYKKLSNNAASPSTSSPSKQSGCCCSIS